MSIKISKIATSKALNCKIHPVLYKAYLQLHAELGAEIVHRRKRTSNTCIEIIFYHEDLAVLLIGHINTLKEAEKCGFFVICRPQTKKGHTFYKGRRVFQLFLSPVHPKKRRATRTTVTPLHATNAAANEAFVG